MRWQGIYEKLKFVIKFSGAASDLFTRDKKPQLDVRSGSIDVAIGE